MKTNRRPYYVGLWINMGLQPCDSIPKDKLSYQKQLGIDFAVVAETT